MSAKPQLVDIKKTADDQPPHPQGAFSHLATELRKRKVCRAAISYVLVLWLNLQIGDVIFPLIGLPDWSLSLIIIIGVMGFPVVLILAWVFQVTPAGIVLDGTDSEEPAADRLLDRAINLLLLCCSIVLAVLLLLQFLTDSRAPLPFLTTEHPPETYLVSKLAFQPASDEASSRALAEGIRAELRHQLINTKGIDLLPEMAQISPQEQRRTLALSGSLRMAGSTAHVLTHLIDLTGQRYLMSVTFNLEVDSEIEVGRMAAERIAREVNRTLHLDEGTLARAELKTRVHTGPDDPV